MTRTNPSLPKRKEGSRRDARGRHASNFSDAVVAAYIHDISARRRSGTLTSAHMPDRTRPLAA